MEEIHEYIYKGRGKGTHIVGKGLAYRATFIFLLLNFNSYLKQQADTRFY